MANQDSATQCSYRAISLRQKLVLASKSSAAEINYDEHLAQKLFLKAVEAGLSSESILSEIKLLLRDPTASDDELIFAVGQVSSADAKRLNKNFWDLKTPPCKLRHPVNQLKQKKLKEGNIKE